MGKETLETERLIEGIVPNLRGVLQEDWNSLYWAPTLPEGKGEGIVIHGYWSGQDEGTEVTDAIYVSPQGSLIQATNGNSQELDLQQYLANAAVAEAAIKAEKERQNQLLINDPDGHTVIWRPGHWLFGKFYAPTHNIGPRDVFVRLGKLYCPSHPKQQLVSYHGEGARQGYTVCPEEHFHYSVFNGT